MRRVVHTLRSSHYATELQFEDLRVPDANVLGEVGRGFAIANDRLSRQRIPYAAACIGVAVKAQELAIEYAKQRETFGAALATRQAIQWRLALLTGRDGLGRLEQNGHGAHRVGQGVPPARRPLLVSGRLHRLGEQVDQVGVGQQVLAAEDHRVVGRRFGVGHHPGEQQHHGAGEKEAGGVRGRGAAGHGVGCRLEHAADEEGVESLHRPRLPPSFISGKFGSPPM